MASPAQSSFDGNPKATPPIAQGYRPTLDDGGPLLQDDTASPPDPESMPVSDVWNYFRAAFASVGRAIGCGGLGLTAGASPAFAFWWTAANLIAVNPFSVASRVGAGHYQIQWVAGTFPLLGTAGARTHLTCPGGAHSYSITSRYMASPPAGMQAIEVWTTQDGALTDLDFMVDLF